MKEKIHSLFINQLKGKNKDLKFTVESRVGHWIDWLVYPNQELYDWFLKYDKRSRIRINGL